MYIATNNYLAVNQENFNEYLRIFHSMADGKGAAAKIDKGNAWYSRSKT
jgi:hypothetical protein